MKYKVGEMVRVKKDLIPGKKYGRLTLCIPYMANERGKKTKIKEITPQGNYFCSNGWNMSEEMLEPIESEGKA